MAELVSMPAYSHGGALKKPIWIVIHSMETDLTDGIAEALSGPNWFGGAKAGTSPHQSFDSLGPGVRNLPNTVVAYHAGPTGNTYGIGKEHAGRASFTRAQWTSDKGMAMLRASAAETAKDCLAENIPPRWLSVVQVARKEPGLCTHNDLRLAFPKDTTHSDVGPNFPFDIYLQLVQDEIARLTGGATAPSDVQEDDDMKHLILIGIKSPTAEWSGWWVANLADHTCYRIGAAEQLVMIRQQGITEHADQPPVMLDRFRIIDGAI